LNLIKLSRHLLDIVSLNQGIEELRKKGTDQANELALVLNTMLWTSSSVKRALSLRVIKNIPKNTGHELYYCLNDNCWCIQSPYLVQRKIGNEWNSFVEQTRQSISLPCLKIIGELFQTLINKKRFQLKVKSKLLFYNISEDEIKAFILELNKKYGSRLTISRISSFLYNSLADYTGDVGDAALITGNLPLPNSK